MWRLAFLLPGCFSISSSGLNTFTSAASLFCGSCLICSGSRMSWIPSISTVFPVSALFPQTWIGCIWVGRVTTAFWLISPLVSLLFNLHPGWTVPCFSSNGICLRPSLLRALSAPIVVRPPMWLGVFVIGMCIIGPCVRSRGIVWLRMSSWNCLVRVSPYPPLLSLVFHRH